MKYAGGSTSNAINTCTQLIADTIDFNGNANFNNNCTGTGVSQITNIHTSLKE